MLAFYKRMFEKTNLKDSEWGSDSDGQTFDEINENAFSDVVEAGSAIQGLEPHLAHTTFF